MGVGAESGTQSVCDALDPRDLALPPAPPTSPGSGATWLLSRGKEVPLPLEGEGTLISLYLVISASTQDQVQRMLRGVRQQEVSLIS